MKLVHLEEALGRMLDALLDVAPKLEEVETGEALGRVVAPAIEAPEDLPGFTRSSMDGYAVLASDTFGAGEGMPAYLELAGEVQMGRPGALSVGPGRALRISTGGALPRGADAVVMVENTELSGNTVEIVHAVAPGENTIERDEDVAKGDVVLRKGQVMGPAQIGALAGLGVTRLSVFASPVVGIISTGDELVPADERPGPGRVRDVNSAALAASVRQAGCIPSEYGIVEDDYERLLEASRRALSGCDALIVSGGSAAGVRDMTVDVLGALGKPGVLAHGIYLKPGKPTLLAVCGGKPVMGFPGNPASALAVFRELMLPVLAHLRGEATDVAPRAARQAKAVMDRSVASATGRVELVPVTLHAGRGGLAATPIMGKSNLIGTLARARGNVRIPEGSEGLERGQHVIVELLE